MTRSINNINFNTLIIYRNVFRKDRNPSFPLKIVAIENKITSLLSLVQYLAFLYNPVNQSSFTMINMRNDRYISYLSLIHIDAADEEDSVDLGGRRIIKKK